MAGTGKKGYTGVTSDGRVISGGIIQSGSSGGSSSSSKSSSSSSSSSGGARVSKETYDNGQPKYVYTSSGKEVPTYGYRVVQRGADGNLYDINNGTVSNIKGGGAYKVGTSADDKESTVKKLASTIVNTAKNPLSGAASTIVNTAKNAAAAVGGGAYGDYGYDEGYGRYGMSGYGGGYDNAYESQIQSILDNILNQKAFDINTDANYKTLYDLYNQSYQQNANRAARDAMGSLAAMTGGYGNTYAQTAGSQAYDTIMQGMNDNNLNLMDIAYNMYLDDLKDQYNQLAAVTGLEQADYAKYLDEWNQNYRLNRDAIEDARYADELAYARDQAALDRQLAQDERDYDRTQDAFSQALSLAKAGYNVPDYLTNTMNTYTGSTGLSDLAGSIAATVQALNAPQTSGGGSSSGSGRSGGSSGSSGKYSTTSDTGGYDWEDVLALYKSGEKSTAQKAYNGLTSKQKKYYDSAVKAMGSTGFGKTR